MQHPIAKYLIYDSGRFLLETIMNLHHFITLLGASVYAVRSIKNWSLGGAFLSLCVFGGYLFHLIWEAGGQYGLGYYVLCVPMAAYGFAQLLGLLQHVSSKHVQNRS